MTLLSVNINKIALLRNSRMNGIPSLVRAAQAVIDAGAGGITVHPRKDARHITLDDVLALAALPAIANREVEFNIEGDLRGELVRVVRAVRPTQFTAVPTKEGEITSSRGWRVYDDLASLREVRELLPEGTRFSVFIDPEPGAVTLATTAGADAIEVYTGLICRRVWRQGQGRMRATRGDRAPCARSRLTRQCRPRSGSRELATRSRGNASR